MMIICRQIGYSQQLMSLAVSRSSCKIKQKTTSPIKLSEKSKFSSGVNLPIAADVLVSWYQGDGLTM